MMDGLFFAAVLLYFAAMLAQMIGVTMKRERLCRAAAAVFAVGLAVKLC